MQLLTVVKGVSTGDVLLALCLHEDHFPLLHVWMCVEKSAAWAQRPFEDETGQLQRDVSGHPRLHHWSCACPISRLSYRSRLSITPLPSKGSHASSQQDSREHFSRLRVGDEVSDIVDRAPMILCVPSVLVRSANRHSFERRSIGETLLLVRLGQKEARSIFHGFFQLLL